MKASLTLLITIACFAQAPPAKDATKGAGDPAKPPEPPKVVQVNWKVKIKTVADDRSEIIVWHSNEKGAVDAATKPTTIGVSGQALKDSLKGWRHGDLASIDYQETATGPVVTRSLTDLTPRTAKDVQGSVGPWVLFASLGVGLLLWIWQGKFVVGEDNRYSNSKFQLALWFTIVIIGYLSTLFVRGFEFGSVNIPTNLLLLSGLSLISFGGAKLATESKTSGSSKRTPASEPNAVRDFVTDADGKADLGDFQMMVITILAAVVYVVQLYGFVQTIEMRAAVSLPDVDNTLLASFGLGQGAYLVKKAVGGVNQ